MEDAHVHLFETREAGIPQPHAHEGSFVKVGVCGEHGGERFWCCVQAVDTDGALRAIVDNDLLMSEWQRGHTLVLRPEWVLEAVHVAHQLSFQRLATTAGSQQQAALAWREARVVSGLNTPRPHTWLVTPPQ